MKIYDSLSYISFTRSDTGIEFDFAELESSIKATDIEKINVLSHCEFSLEEIEIYIEAIKAHKSLSPVISWNPKLYSGDLKEKLLHYKEQGVLAIKVHPRYADLSLLDQEVKEIFSIAEEIGMVLMVCSYSWGSKDGANFYSALYSLVESHPNLKIMIAHGGGVELLRYIEMARAFNNILIDLSFTLLKYQGSSLDKDIEFAFNNFDRRLCVGCDFPDFQHSDFDKRFKELSKGLSEEKLANISHKNLEKFLASND